MGGERDIALASRYRLPAMLTPPRAICFDMDGTLTRPLLDFDAIRAEIGVTGPILEAIRHFDASRRATADAVLDRHEFDAARRSTLNDGCLELLADLVDRGVPTALITRNSCRCMNVVLARHGLRFDACLSREDEPVKPDPEPVRRACRSLGVTPGEAWMVGDGWHDIEAGNAAGATTIWLSHGDAAPTRAARPTATVATLIELHELLRATLDSPTAVFRV